MSEWSEKLATLYYTPGFPGALGGLEKFYKYAKKQHPSLSRDVVSKWLTSQDTYTLHKPYKSKFERRPTVVGGKGHQLQVDLLDVSSHSNHNDGVKFLLIVVDAFSRKAWIETLTSKSGERVAEALEKVLEDADGFYYSLQSDKGKEFYNARVADVLKKRNIKHFSSENETIKASIVERFNRTLRDRLHRYLTARNTRRFIHVLGDFVDAYNDTEHRAIGVAPNEVNSDNQASIFRRLYDRIPSTKQILDPLQVGDKVRITKARGAFERGYTPNWTREIFTVVEVLAYERPTVYRIVDYIGEEIRGTFYRRELQRVKEPEVYSIEKVIRTRRYRGKKQHLVKWLGYPDSFNSWVDDKDMTDI